jgi:hypothetical protein
MIRLLIFGCLAAAAPALAAPAFPPGHGAGFPVPENVEWTGPSIEPFLEHGLRLKVARMDGEKEGGTVGAIRDWYLRALAEAGWVVPKHLRPATLERFEETFYRVHEGKLQLVELSIIARGEQHYVVAKAFPDRALTQPLDLARVPQWRLPEGHAEDFPFHPLAEPHSIELLTIKDVALGVQPFEVAKAVGFIPGATLSEARAWYLGRLKADRWPIPSFFFHDDEDKFVQSFARRRDKKRMAAELTLEQRDVADPVRFTIRAQQNESVQIDDEMAALMEQEQAREVERSDPALLIVDVDPDDPDIDFIELPRGWGAGFPIPPELQFIAGKLHSREVIGQKWRDAKIEGVLLDQTVREARAWYLKAAAGAGYEVATIHEEDDEDTFKTRFRRGTGNFVQSIRVHLFTRPEDGFTHVVIIAAEDLESGGSSAPENPEAMMGIGPS